MAPGGQVLVAFDECGGVLTRGSGSEGFQGCAGWVARRPVVHRSSAGAPAGVAASAASARGATATAAGSAGGNTARSTGQIAPDGAAGRAGRVDPSCAAAAEGDGEGEGPERPTMRAFFIRSPPVDAASRERPPSGETTLTDNLLPNF